MPFLLHAAWLRGDSALSNVESQDGALFLWGEDTDARLSAAQLNGGDAMRADALAARKIPSHPAQIPIGRLRSLLSSDLSAALANGMELQSASVWLPSRQGLPVVKRGLFSRAVEESTSAGQGGVERLRDRLGTQAHTGEDSVTLAPWQVTGLTLTPDAALTFLSGLDARSGVHLAGSQSLGSIAAAQSLYHLRTAKDLQYWSAAAKFVLELLAGQYFLPSVRPISATAFQAVWQPSLLDPRIKERLEHMVEAMPPVCRAYNLARPDDAPAPTTLLEHFVTCLVDASIRGWMAEGQAGIYGNGNGSTNGSTSGKNNGVHIDLAGDNLDERTVTDAITSEASAEQIDEQSASVQWLRTLLQRDRWLHLPPHPLHLFYQEWSGWIEQLYVINDTNFRICFELEEPDALLQPNDVGTPGEQGTEQDKAQDRAQGTEQSGEQDSAWKLRYYLQARDNPTLLVPAAKVWTTRGNVLRVSGRRLDQPHERLLAGLGAASRLSSPIERSLRSPQPEMALLSTDEAYTFLRETGPLLESSGFGLLLPLWWRTGDRQRLGLRLRLLGNEGEWPTGSTEHEQIDYAVSTSTGGDPSRPIRYRWELTLGQQSLTEEEFEQLAARKTPLLNLRGQWVELEPRQISAAKNFFDQRQPVGTMSLLQAVRMVQAQGTPLLRDAEAESDQLPLTELPSDLPLDTVEAEGWLQRSLEALQNHTLIQNLAEPEGFVGSLRPYQRRGVAWLAYLRKLGLGACLADDMGLGKTIQAIALMLHVREIATARGEAVTPALLVCPTSVVTNWRREVERFAPGLRPVIHHGNARAQGDEFDEVVRTHDLIITSYGTARRDIELLMRHPWSDLILDEAQNIKNPAAKQTQAVRRIHSVNRMALTGTPVENRLAELWSIVEFLNPGYLGRFDAFRRRYIVPIERYSDSDSAGELRSLVQPFLLRRLKSDPTIISDLPAKTEMVVYCPLTKEQADLYEKVVRETLQHVEGSAGIQRRGLVLGLLTKLKQVCNHPAHYLKQSAPLSRRSGKLMRLTEMLEEALSVNDRALVFTQFVEMGHLLQRHLRETLGVPVLFLHGGITAQQRDEMVQRFQSKDGPPIFVLSLRAGGSGLNLTHANHVFHFDRWWNPAVENQATDRAFRIGQQRNVQVHKFVVAGTLEEHIHNLIESKQALAETIVGSGEDWLTELDTDQLRELLMLHRETFEQEGQE